MENRPPDIPSPTPPLTTRVETARLVLRPPRTSDLPELRAHLRRSAEHLRPWSPAPRGGDDPTSITSLSKSVLRQRKEWKDGTSYACLVATKGGREPIVGRVTLGAIVRGVFQNSYLGYEIDSNAIGLGYASEAVGGALEFAFTHLKVHRVQAAVMPVNDRSLRVVGKLGFRREGHAERYLCIANVWEDHVLFAMTYEDWVANADKRGEGATFQLDKDDGEDGPPPHSAR